MYTEGGSLFTRLFCTYTHTHFEYEFNECVVAHIEIALRFAIYGVSMWELHVYAFDFVCTVSESVRRMWSNDGGEEGSRENYEPETRRFTFCILALYISRCVIRGRYRPREGGRPVQSSSSSFIQI